MKSRALLYVSLGTYLLLLTMQLTDRGPIAAQDQDPMATYEPVAEPVSPPRDGLREAPDGTWYREADAPDDVRSRTPMALQSTGGPDDFGYTWDDSVAFSWIDATSGTDTGIDGDTIVAGPISLPFSFKFYEETYTQLYISKHGYVGFTNDLWDSQNEIPDSGIPNNIIAPYWTPLLVNEDGYTGQVYYATGGSDPNRYVVVEWHEARGDYEPEVEIHTFEVILYENGDILVQHADMVYGRTYWCGHVGIEDSRGWDGLAYGDFCQRYDSNTAIRFYRPAPAARVGLSTPSHLGEFAGAGRTAAYEIVVRNTGELGTDTYDFHVYSPWPTALYEADGLTLLADTDHGGLPDTGSLTQGSSATVVVKTTAPVTASLGDANTASVVVASSLDTSKNKTVLLDGAVPAQFAQTYRDTADSAPSLLLASPKGTRLIEASSYWTWGSDAAVAESPSEHFVSIWSDGYSDGYGHYWRDLRYSLVDPCGHLNRGVSSLTDNSSTAYDTYESEPVVAVVPDGRIGILWKRYLYDTSTGTTRYLYNIYFAVLDEAGNVTVVPMSLTNNNEWYQSSPPTYGAPRYFNPRIAATGDNRFLLAWEVDHQESTGWVDDIVYTVRSASGAEVRSVTMATADTPGGDNGYSQPSLAQLKSSPVLLTWMRDTYYNNEIFYTVLASNGAVVKSATKLSTVKTAVDRWNSDAVQLSDGRIAVFWEVWGCSAEYIPGIRYAVLDSSYSLVVAPTCRRYTQLLSMGQATCRRPRTIRGTPS